MAALQRFLVEPVKLQLVERYASHHQDWRIAAVSMNGWRKDMEDAHVVHTSLPGQDDTCFVGVFDGHSNGRSCADYLAENLLDRLMPATKVPTPPQIKHRVLALDKAFLATPAKDCGSTAVFAFVTRVVGGGESKAAASESRSFEITVGNVGDSRALLVRSDGSFVQLSTDHRCSDKQEAERYRKAGGDAKHPSILTRSFGDKYLKSNTKLKEHEQLFIAAADVATATANAGDSLLLFCDGLIECMSNATLVAAFVEALKTFPADPAAALRVLLDRALPSGSRDNMTCLVVQLGAGDEKFGATEKSPRKELLHNGCSLTTVLNDKAFKRAVRGEFARSGLSQNERVAIFQLGVEAEVRRKQETGTLMEQAAVKSDSQALLRQLRENPSKFVGAVKLSSSSSASAAASASSSSSSSSSTTTTAAAEPANQQRSAKRRRIARVTDDSQKTSAGESKRDPKSASAASDKENDAAAMAVDDVSDSDSEQQQQHKSPVRSSSSTLPGVKAKAKTSSSIADRVKTKKRKASDRD